MSTDCGTCGHIYGTNLLCGDCQGSEIAKLLGDRRNAPARRNVVFIETKVVNFLNGCGQLDGYNFGETPPGEGAFWWRKYLPKLQPMRKMYAPPNGTALKTIDN